MRGVVVGVLLALGAWSGELRAQNLIIVPFTNGFIGTRGSSAGTANNVLTFATLGIARTFFIQNSSTNAFELQGNDVPGTLRIVRTDGTTLDIPASANWRNSGGTTYLIGILPRPTAPITLAYATGSIQITNGDVSGGSSVGAYVAAYAGTPLANGASTSGNAAQSQVLSGLNSYLATVTTSRPAGPVTVSALTTTSTTPTITGGATLGANENLSVVVNGAQHTATTTPAVVVSGTSWSLALTSALAVGTYSVTATITNPDGFTLSDATSDELVVSAAGGSVTIGGSFTANGRTYDGTTAATGTTSGLTLVGVAGSDEVTIASVTLAFATASAGASKPVAITAVTLGGADAARYTVSLAGAPTATATIAEKALTIAGVSAADRAYDGTTTATLAGTASYVGLVAGETFAVAGTPTATFASAAVGSAKAVTVAGYAAPSANYTVAQPAGLTAAVTARTLTVGGSFDASDRTYDGTTAATIATNALALVGVVGGDAVSLTGASAAFGDAAVGAAKPVTLSAAALAGAAAGNYTLSLAGAPTTTASVTVRPLTITGLSGTDRAYDGTTTATLTGTPSYVGLAAGESFTVAGTPTATFGSAAVGAGKPVTVAGYAAPNANYAVTQPTGLTAAITARALTIGGTFAVADRAFDGTTTAAIATNALTLVGVVAPDVVALTGVTAAFADAAVGAAKRVSLSAAGLTGAAAANYTLALAGAPTTTASITSAGGTVTIAGTFAASDRTYDGTTTATGTTSGLTLVGVAGSDEVTIASVTLAFASAGAGAGKPVAITAFTLGGADAARYTVSLAGAPTATATIAARALTIAGVSAADRVYDGTTTATLAGTASYVGLVAGETFAVGGTPSASFASASVGAAKTVTVAGYAAPNANYTVAQPTGLTASVTARTVTVGGAFTAASKVFDGVATATIATNALTLVGAVGGDAVSLTGVTAAFASAAVGTAKLVSLDAGTLAGAAAPNYVLSLAGAPTATADITTAGGTVTIAGAFSTRDRVYDGTTAATGTTSGLTLVGVAGSDHVTIASVSLAFQTPSAGSGKTVVITAVTLGGADATRYAVSLAGAPTTTASVTARPLTITGLSAADRVYDGTTTATLTGTPSYVGLAGGESVAVAGTPTATFATAAVGASKSVAVAGYSAPNANYTVAQPAGLTASVTAKPVTLGGAFTVASRTYDGTTAATIVTNGLTLVGVVGTDAVAPTGVTAAFATAAVGANKPVTVTGASLSGAAAGNYALSLAGAPTTTASITSTGGTVTIGGTFTASDRTYDGTTAATGTTSGLTLVGVSGSDQVTIASVTLAFASASAGTSKPVTITAVTLGGADAARYAVSLAGTPTAAASVTARPLGVTGVSASSRVYDGTASATLAGAPSYTGLVAGESHAVAGTPTARFADASVGTGKAVTVAGYAPPNANYTLAQPTGLAASVTPRALTLGGSFTAASRPFDGTTTATITTSALALIGVVAGDAVSLTGVTAAFASAGVGTAKPVALSAASLAGAAAANYTLSLAGAPTTTASITTAGGTVTVAGTFTASDRTYDGTTTATGTTSGLTLAGVIAPDQVTIASVTLGFATAAVGTGKTVVITGVTLGGADAAHYAVSLTGAPTATASIVRRPLTIGGSFGAASRVYDRTTAATIAASALTLVGAVHGDDVALGGLAAAFATPSAGTGKPVALGAAALTGSAAANYSLALAGAPTTTAAILARAVTVAGTFAAADKVFDGSAFATIVADGLRVVGALPGDDLAIAGAAAAFADAAVGAGKPVALTAATLAGAAAGNYVLTLAGAPTAAATIVAATPPSAPRNVVGATGDGSMAVTWSVPADAGCRAVTGYAVEHSADGGRSWTRGASVDGGASTVLLGGLANNVAHLVRVAAVNPCGTGPFSAAAGPVVPVAPTRGGDGRVASSDPGTAAVTTNGVRQPLTTEVVQDTIVRVAGGAFTLRLRASDQPGAVIPVDSTRTLALEHGGQAAADGSGFAPGTYVSIYLSAPTAAPLLLGTAPVTPDGAFATTMPIAATLAAGHYTLQVNGIDRTAAARSVAIGVEVVPPPPDLELVATPDQLSPAVGDTLTITLTVTNQGRGPAIDVVIPRAFKEPGFTVVQTTPLEGAYDARTQEWTIARIETGASARMRLTVVVVPPAALSEATP